MRSLEDCSVFFGVCAGRRGLVLLSARSSGFGEAEVDFGKSFWQRVQKCHRRGTVCYRDGAVIPEVLALPSFPSFEERSGVDIFGWKRALALGRAGIVLLLGLGFADLLSDLAESDLLSDLFWKNRKHGFHGRVLLYVPSIEHR